MKAQIPLSEAKSKLSEIVRSVRRGRGLVIITVDGEQAAAIVPLEEELRDLTELERATARALFEALLGMARTKEHFDAVELVREGRR